MSNLKLSKAGKVVLGVLVLLGLFLAKTYWWDNRPEVVAEREAKAKQDSIALAKENIDTTHTVVTEPTKTETEVTPEVKTTQTVSEAPVKSAKTQKVKEKKSEAPKEEKPAPKKTAPKKNGERENLEFNNF